MAVIRIGVEGMSPLMMNSADPMIQVEIAKRQEQEGAAGKLGARKKKEPPFEEVCEAACYRLPEGNLGFPSTAFAKCSFDAAKGMKSPVAKDRMGLQSRIQGLYQIEAGRPDGMLVVTSAGDPVTKWEMDLRTGVNKNVRPPARIVLARPVIALPWEMTFDVIYNPDFSVIENFPETLVALLNKGGASIGVGAFRPEKGGWFGKFRVAEWSVEE